jgi:flagellin
LVAAINAKTAQTGVTAALKEGTTDQLTLTATDGRNITTTLGDAVPGGLENFADAGSTTTYAALTLTSTKGNSTIGITGGDGGIAKVGIASGDLTDGKLTLAASTVTGQTVSAVDLSTQANAQKALSILDAAIDTVTNSRANLGAYQNRFEAAISNLETTSTNLQASRSRILDTDYAKETTNLAKSQIVQQAATAMLAQANQSSQSVLALLK